MKEWINTNENLRKKQIIKSQLAIIVPNKIFVPLLMCNADPGDLSDHVRGLETVYKGDFDHPNISV